MRAFRSDGAIAAMLASLAVLLYEITGVGHPTFFDYDARLARALLAGRWWLDAAPAPLNELVPCGADRFCVAYPPLPALVVVPLVPFFATATAQTLASAICGGLSAAPAFLAVRAVGVPRPVAVLTVVFAIAGTTLWFTASTGDAWFYAHAVAVLFTSVAVLGALRGWPAWSIGVLVALGALARFPVVLALPALAYLVAVARRESYRMDLARALAGALPLVLLELGYNVLRWGSPGEAGYAYLTTDNPVTPYGLFDIRYVPDHLFALFVRPPEVGDAPFVLRPSRWGMSLLLLSPAYLFLIPAARRLRVHPALGALLVAGALALLPDVLHGGVGARQLGYRFSLDAQPFLLPVLAVGAMRSRWLSPAVVWSVLANAYCVIAIATVGYA